MCVSLATMLVALQMQCTLEISMMEETDIMIISSVVLEVRDGAVSIPESDAAAQDALDNLSIKCVKDR